MTENAAVKLSPIKQTFRYWKRYFRLDIILAILYLASLVSPTMTGLTRYNYAYPVFFALYLCWFITAILYYRKRNKFLLVDKSRFPEMAALLVFLAVVSAYAILGRGENGYWAILYIIMFMTVYMMDYIYTTYSDAPVIKLLLHALFFIFALHSLISCIILQTEPFAARLMNAYYLDDIERFARLELLGLGDYPFFTSLAIILPVFFFMVIKSRHKIILTIMYVLCVAGIFYSGYTGSTMLVYLMMLLMLVYALFFCKDKARKKHILFLLLITLIIIVLILLVFVPKDLQAEYFIKYRDLLKFIWKFDELDIKIVKDPSVGGNAEDYAKIGYRTASRVSFYWKSITTFFEYPIFGVGPYFKSTVDGGIGNHSSWLDFLAMYGIAGCSPLIICFILLYRRNIKSLIRPLNKFIKIMPWIFFIGYGFVNPVFVARCFPAVFSIGVSGDVAMGSSVVEFRKWIVFWKKDKSKDSK